MVDPYLLREGGILFLVLVASISIHEWAHAWTADRLGDDLPRSQGRVTLNPIAHIDAIGTILIPILNIFIFRGQFVMIGWGRPVISDPSNFPRQIRARNEMLVIAAGPLSNLVLALIGVIGGAILYRIDPKTIELVRPIVMMNVALAVFNLLPLPPLDGGNLMRIFTGMHHETYYNISRWGGLILLFLINIPAFRFMLGSIIQIAVIPYNTLFRILAG